MERADIAVVGAGVVGLAVAARLARRGRSIVGLETHSRYGVETSSRNSEVLHAGLYYAPGSLKMRLCHEGRRRLYELCPKAGIGFKKTGKLVVATDEAELAGLAKLKEKAEACGAEGLALIGAEEAARRVPGLKAVGAVWSPESGIIDSEGLMRYFHAKAEENGAAVLFNAAVTAVDRQDGGYALSINGGEEKLWSAVVVNSAGLHADRLAAMAGIEPDAAGYRLHWCKGCYFRCRRPLGSPHLVYPVPAKHGLGIHLTLDLAGQARFGPDTEFVDALDYDVDAARAGAFHEAVARYLPAVRREDLAADTSGIRPKLTGPEGGYRDFVIAEESARGLPGWINLIGIESPGLTASPAIAEEVARLC